MYQRIVTSSAKRSLKKLPRRVREDLIEATKILEDKLITIHFGHTRENFYEKLRRLFR